MTANLRVVDAHYPADFERLRAVREPVFVIEQHCPIEEEWDALDAPSAHALVLNERDEPVATGRLTSLQSSAAPMIRIWPRMAHQCSCTSPNDTTA